VIPVDVRAIRLSLDDWHPVTQEAFARRFGFSTSVVRDWEQGRRTPTGPAQTLLRLIARDPIAMELAIHALCHAPANDAANVVKARPRSRSVAVPGSTATIRQHD
jgi:transcriptional regulator with XRE-family HTH domain